MIPRPGPGNFFAIVIERAPRTIRTHVSYFRSHRNDTYKTLKTATPQR